MAAEFDIVLMRRLADAKDANQFVLAPIERALAGVGLVPDDQIERRTIDLASDAHQNVDVRQSMQNEHAVHRRARRMPPTRRQVSETPETLHRSFRRSRRRIPYAYAGPAPARGRPFLGGFRTPAPSRRTAMVDEGPASENLHMNRHCGFSKMPPNLSVQTLMAVTGDTVTCPALK